MERFTITTELPVSPKAVYSAWVDSDAHLAMTQAPVSASTEIAGIFTAHDGYINGINLELDGDKRILQSWRTSEFNSTDPGSSLQLVFEPIKNGTRLTLTHSNLPDGQADDFESGWQDIYFNPMLEYFSENLSD